ncbi:hypothetical protein E2986_09897 [Frieseomelitta varia]|uniref:Uncharacterized protein n=1 Tax=Frieseomelitta varia TaxID=561572 RepID=A0A833VZ78_9HYME|nr:hypothetical protein E2986_09897 [Frieseomelitta varia]
MITIQKRLRTVTRNASSVYGKCYANKNETWWKCDALVDVRKKMDVERSFKLIGTSWRKEVFCSDCKFHTRASTFRFGAVETNNGITCFVSHSQIESVQSFVVDRRTSFYYTDTEIQYRIAQRNNVKTIATGRSSFKEKCTINLKRRRDQTRHERTFIESKVTKINENTIWSVPHVLLLATQGVQRKISIKPPPRIRAIMARIVHTVDAEVTRADNSLLAAGKSTTSSVPRPNLLALPSKNLRRRDVFSQDILAGPPILYPINNTLSFDENLYEKALIIICYNTLLRCREFERYFLDVLPAVLRSSLLTKNPPQKKDFYETFLTLRVATSQAVAKLPPRKFHLNIHQNFKSLFESKIKKENETTLLFRFVVLFV